MQPIIKDLPIPQIRRRGAKTKYPWRDMRPGDAFQFVSGVTLKSAYAMAHQEGQNFGMRYAVRRDAQDRIICWRVDGLPEYTHRNANYREDVDLIKAYRPLGPSVDEEVVGWRPREEPDEEMPI